MKKLLAVLLALLLALSMVACGNDSETESDTDVATNTETDTEAGTETESETEIESEIVTDTESETETETETETEGPDADFESRNETVYVNGADPLNVRSTPTTAPNNKLGELKLGDAVQRIGYGGDWSKIVWNGVECYASSLFLSVKQPITIKTADPKNVYVNTSSLRVREYPWAEATEVAYFSNDSRLIQIGIAEEADEFDIIWAHVSFTDEKGNAKEGYVNSKYLTEEAPLAFNELDEIVVVTCEKLSLRAYPSRTDSEVLFVVNTGDELQRIGIAVESDEEDILWSKVIYKGQTCYASSAYLVKKETTAEFSVDEMTIVLANTFEERSAESAAQKGYNSMIASGEITVGIVKELFDKNANNEADTSITAETYASLLIEHMNVEADVVTEGDLVYFEYEIPATDDTAATERVVFIYKSLTAFWQVHFFTYADAYDAYEATIFQYANSVTFSVAE